MNAELLATYWPLIVGGLIVLIIFIVLLMRRRQHVEIGSVDPVIAPTLARTARADPIIAEMSPPVSVFAPAADADDLRRIKGLGPKVAAQLNAAGIMRYDQLAALDPAEQVALDAQLGTFTGRMARDRWIEQAQLLARDDIAGFEAEFGKLS